MSIPWYESLFLSKVTHYEEPYSNLTDYASTPISLESQSSEYTERELHLLELHSEKFKWIHQSRLQRKQFTLTPIHMKIYHGLIIFIQIIPFLTLITPLALIMFSFQSGFWIRKTLLGLIRKLALVIFLLIMVLVSKLFKWRTGIDLAEVFNGSNEGTGIVDV